MKKIGVICLAVVLALGTLGVGFAMWSETLYIDTWVEAGELDWEFVPNSFFQHDTGIDDTCDTGIINIRPVDPPKDVGSTSGSFSDTDGDTDLDLLTVIVDNAYPCYYNEMSMKVHNNGTIPLHIAGATLTYDGDDYALPDGIAVTTDDGVLEFRWGNNTGQQMHPCLEYFELSFEVHVLQPAVEGETYEFTISLVAVQWNE